MFSLFAQQVTLEGVATSIVMFPRHIREMDLEFGPRPTAGAPCVENLCRSGRMEAMASCLYRATAGSCLAVQGDAFSVEGNACRFQHCNVTNDLLRLPILLTSHDICLMSYGECTSEQDLMIDRTLCCNEVANSKVSGRHWGREAPWRMYMKQMRTRSSG